MKNFFLHCTACFILFLNFLPGIAQKIEGIKVMESEANKKFATELFAEALPMYLILDSLQPQKGQTIARIGIAYLNLPTKYRALPYLEKASDLHYTKDGLDYYLGRAYHLKHEFDQAISSYDSFKKQLSNKNKIKEMDDLIQQCNIGKELVLHPVEASVENLGSTVNSAFSDFAPVITADESELIFTSKRPNSGSKDENFDYYEDIYISTKDQNKWGTPKNIGNRVNTKVNDASIGVSVDGQQLFIYKNDTLDKDDSGGDIFESELINKSWSVPKRLNTNINTSAWEPSASMMADENILFFSSDREGGFGGTDIYLSKRLPDNTWGPAKNLGALINTAYDEDAPFIHPDSKTLYFSSNGKKSMGGFDIFTCNFNRKNDSVSLPENIGYPVNTADDELFFVWSADGKRGYFSATKEDGFGEEDIYIVHRPNIKMDLVLLNGQIRAMNKIINAKIRVIDNASNEVVAVYDSTKFKGNYTILLDPGKNYTVSIEADNYLSTSENIEAPLNGFVKIEKNIDMTPLDKGGMTALNNVFFGKHEFEPKKESFWELDRYYGELKDRKNLFMEIADHSNDFGNDHQNNLQLSKKRAKAVADYLIEKGIESSRIKAVGYGDQFQTNKSDSISGNKKFNRTELIIAQNLNNGPVPEPYLGHYFSEKGKKSESVKPLAALESGQRQTMMEDHSEAGLTEEQLLKKSQIHIRKLVESGMLQPVLIKGTVIDAVTLRPLQAPVELVTANGKILSGVTSGKDGHYNIKSYLDQETACTLSVSKQGYNFFVKPLFVPANSIERTEINIDMGVKKLDVGTKFTLRNIYYDFDQTSLRPESFNELNHLEEMLKQNPQIRIEIAGHTDSNGPEYYNKVLSQRRSQAVVNYLLKKGISFDRVLAKGYGENHPFASNDDELEGRELNRRTEILILKNR